MYWTEYQSGNTNYVKTLATPYTTWAATTPWPLNTHWFISGVTASITHQIGVGALGNSHKARAFYYNDDFLLDEARTNVEHYVSVSTYARTPSGNVATFDWEFYEAGEFSTFIFNSQSFSLAGAQCYYLPCLPGTGF